jgi:tetratricopeptide (TPR) repeat protein
MLLTLMTYFNATQGSFVYDDEFQIVKNPQIKPGGDIWQAVTSDVWSFRVGAGEPRSNYWRPVFIAFLTLNYRLFGLEATGWHVVNILIHMLVTLLGYRLLLALPVRPVAGAIAVWIFATHPAHIQSVTWISGSPDLLMSFFLMSCMICYVASRERTGWGWRVAAVLLFTLALLSKEAALAFIGILFLSDVILNREEGALTKTAAMAAIKRCSPFLAAGLIFILVRYQILHSMRELAPGAPGIGDVMLTVPSILIFYIRQIFFPFEFGPIYGVRYVNSTNIGLMNFLLPVVLLAAFAFVAYRLFKRNSCYRIALIWFLLPLALVLDPRAFVSEMLVQDRYLYLPIFGAAILTGGVLLELAGRIVRGGSRKAEVGALAAGLSIACVLGVITLRFNPVWANGVALWEQGVRVDPSSAFAHAQLGNEYQRAGRLAEAKQETSRAIELRPDLTTAYLTRGTIAVRERRYDDAERDLKQVLNAFPDYDVAREQLALAYQQQARLDESLALFNEGRRLIPAKQALYTINIAVLDKLANRNAEAQSELESLLPILNSTSDPDLLIAWWYLGELYRVQGKADSAGSAYAQYLKITEGNSDPQVRRFRDLATQSLQQLKTTGEGK